MIYKVKFSTRFKKSFKRFKSDKNFKKEEFDKVINKLLNKEKLEDKYRNHTLSGEYIGMNECHIQNDVLLIYFYEDEELILYAIDIGSHSELFK